MKATEETAQVSLSVSNRAKRCVRLLNYDQDRQKLLDDIADQQRIVEELKASREADREYGQLSSELHRAKAYSKRCQKASRKKKEQQEDDENDDDFVVDG